jgi:hypothetical protein
MTTFEQLGKRYDQAVADGNAFNGTLVADYMRLGLSEVRATQMAPNSPSKPNAMAQRLMTQDLLKKEYYGAPVEGDAARTFGAVATLGDWLYGDESPFSFTVHTLINKAKHKINLTLDRDVTTRSGLHAFGVTPENATEGFVVPLLEQLRIRTADRGHVALMAAIDTKDELVADSFQLIGGKPVPFRRTGTVSFNGVDRTLRLYDLDTR